KLSSSYIKKFIKIMKSLKELRNFSSLVAIYYGLSNNMIQNFKVSWNKLSKAKKNIYNNISLLFGWKMKELKLLQEESLLPTIPHIGLYLETLYNIHENNKLKSNDIKNKNNINYISMIIIASKIENMLM